MASNFSWQFGTKQVWDFLIISNWLWPLIFSYMVFHISQIFVFDWHVDIGYKYFYPNAIAYYPLEWKYWLESGFLDWGIITQYLWWNYQWVILGAHKPFSLWYCIIALVLILIRHFAEALTIDKARS